MKRKMGNFLVFLQNKRRKRMHEKMKLEEELREKCIRKSNADDVDTNLLLIIAAIVSFNSQNGAPRAPKKRLKLRVANGCNSWDEQEFKSHLGLSTGSFQYTLNIVTPDIEKTLPI